METPMLVAPHFDLIPLKRKDAGAMFSRWMTDKDVARYCTWVAHKDISETQSLVDTDIELNAGDTYYSWGLFFDDLTHGSNRPRIFGHVTLNVNPDLRLGTLGYTLMKAEWGKGYAPEAIASILRFCFGQLGLSVVNAAVRVENRASCRVLEKSGLNRQYEFNFQGANDIVWPMVRYQITRDQYFSDSSGE